MTTERQSILSRYFKEYLINIRNLSQSSAEQYLQALRTVSDMLAGEKLVWDDIYEIQDLDLLMSVADRIMASVAYYGKRQLWR